MAPKYSVSPVLAWSQEVLLSSVVWPLIENPISFKNMARLDIAVMKFIKNRRAVMCELHYPASEVNPFVDSDLVGAPDLCG